eukprot:365171-Chlamydomonas_euryale.AAC.19
MYAARSRLGPVQPLHAPWRHHEVRLRAPRSAVCPCVSPACGRSPFASTPLLPPPASPSSPGGRVPPPLPPLRGRGDASTTTTSPLSSPSPSLSRGAAAAPCALAAALAVPPPAGPDVAGAATAAGDEPPLPSGESSRRSMTGAGSGVVSGAAPAWPRPRRLDIRAGSGCRSTRRAAEQDTKAPPAVALEPSAPGRCARGRASGCVCRRAACCCRSLWCAHLGVAVFELPHLPTQRALLHG